MTPDQALQILDRASALAALPRQDHVAVQQALSVLAAVIAPRPPAPTAAPVLAMPEPATDSPCG